MAISILLADDSPTIAKILTLSLASEDYAVRTVDTAERAIEELQKETPLIFLVDASLPGQDGFALSRFVKGNAKLAPVTRVILLANAFDPLDEGACAEAGIDAVITKPFDPAQLRTKLRELLAVTPKLGNVTPTTQGVDNQAPSTTDEVQFSAITENVDIELSPSAKQLAEFFYNEVDTKAAEAAAEITRGTQTDIPELSPSAQALATFFNAEVDAHKAKQESGKTPEETLDFSNAGTDWNTLSQWSSAPPASSDMFDTGNSNFIFTDDYVNRITRSFAGTNEEEQANRKKAVAAESPSAPKLVREVHAEAPAPAPAPATALSKEDLERIVREEVRSICREAVEKVAWEVIPELAENLIRKELDKVLKSLEP